MKERNDPAGQHGPSGPFRHAGVNTCQPMSLAAVLRHVLALDGELGSTASGAAPMATDSSGLRQLNDRLGAALDICLQLDTARLQLQNAIGMQRELQTVLEMLVARVDAGQASPIEVRRVAAQLGCAGDKVFDAVAEWNCIGQRFTRHTRLLPAQLVSVVETSGPLAADEMDRLAEACLWARAAVHLSLGQRSSHWSDQRAGVPLVRGGDLEDFPAWDARMEMARVQCAADFSAAREAYLQAVLNLDREHARFVRARSLRRTAQAVFRFGPRRSIAFTEAIVKESQHLHAVLALQARRSAAMNRLYALAGWLPRQFGLVEPARH